MRPNTFAANIDYLLDAWSEKEVKKFVLRSQYVLLNIEENPRLYPASNKKKNIRRVIVNRQITLFFRYYPTQKIVVLLSFWNNYQDSRKSPIS